MIYSHATKTTKHEIDRSLPLFKAFEIDSQLQALLVKVAAFEPQCLGGLRNVPVVPVQFFEHLFALEIGYPRGKSAAGIHGGGIVRSRALMGESGIEMSGRQCELNGIGIDQVASEQQKPLDDVTQLADIARPRVVPERVDGFIGKGSGLPAVLRADLADKVLDERGKIFRALAQRGQRW